MIVDKRQRGGRRRTTGAGWSDTRRERSRRTVFTATGHRRNA